MNQIINTACHHNLLISLSESKKGSSEIECTVRVLAMANFMCEEVWIWDLLRKLPFVPPSFRRLYCDNKGSFLLRRSWYS